MSHCFRHQESVILGSSEELAEVLGQAKDFHVFCM